MMDDGHQQREDQHGQVNKQYNVDGTYSGSYADMVRVPRSSFMFMLNSAKQVIPSINAHVVAGNVAKARKHANDPAIYNFHMNRARLYKKYTINNPDVDSRIRKSLTDPALQEMDKKLATIRTNSKMLKTPVGMKHYQNIIIQRKKRFKVLENDERERYHRFVDNPSGSNLEDSEPRSMKDVPYHSSALRSVLSRYPDIMQTDPTHNLYIMGKHISDDPAQEGRLIHYLTHDYADIHNVPHGTRELIDALLKRGFRIEDIGNKYIREHLIQKRNGVVRRTAKSPGAALKQENVSPPVFSPHPPTSPKPRHIRSKLPVTTTPKHQHSASHTPPTSRQILRHLEGYRKKQQTPQHSGGFAPGVRPRGKRRKAVVDEEEITDPSSRHTRQSAKAVRAAAAAARQKHQRVSSKQEAEDESPPPSHRTRSKRSKKSRR